MDPSELIAQASRPKVAVTLCLNGDLQAQWEQADAELRRAKDHARRADASLSDGADIDDLQARFDDLEEQLRSHELTVTMQGLRRVDWDKLVQDHPPTEGDKVHQVLGYNHTTFFPDLVAACIVDLSEQDIGQLLDVVTSGQFDALADAALEVCRRKVSIPFASAASGRTADSDGS